MNRRKPLIQMLQQLLKDMEIVSSQGAGYYTCVPFARRFNKLRGQAALMFPASDSLMSTFEELSEIDPKDPSEKGNVLLGVRVETTQLIALLESTEEESEA